MQFPLVLLDKKWSFNDREATLLFIVNRTQGYASFKEFLIYIIDNALL